MQSTSQPTTPTPSRLLGVVLLGGGGVFLGDSIWHMATYPASLPRASAGTWIGLLVGTVLGAVLVAVGVAILLHSTTHLKFVSIGEWEL